MIDAKDVGYYSAEIRHLGYNANLDVDEKALCEIVADMLLDHAPLTREELEEVLKEAGWQWNETLRDFSMGQESIWCDKERLFCEKLATTYITPLSAVTRATLRNCGVIK